jgi:predicted HTH domain antitoxin
MKLLDKILRSFVDRLFKRLYAKIAIKIGIEEIMKSIGIKELQKNPSLIAKWLENKEYTIITKRNRPIGIAVSFDDKIISNGLKTAFLIEAYESSVIGLNELAKSLNMRKKEAMKFLSSIGVDVIDYDFKDDLKTIKKFLD